MWQWTGIFAKSLHCVLALLTHSAASDRGPLCLPMRSKPKMRIASRPSLV